MRERKELFSRKNERPTRMGWLINRFWTNELFEKTSNERKNYRLSACIIDVEIVKWTPWKILRLITAETKWNILFQKTAVSLLEFCMSDLGCLFFEKEKKKKRKKHAYICSEFKQRKF